MTIIWRAVPPTTIATKLLAPTTSGVCWQADSTTLLLEIPGLARFQVHAGMVQYANLAEVEETVLYKLGGGLPVAMAWMQKGYLALHAAAVTTPTGAVVFAGPSAAGKSVMAAALALCGYPVLVDEVAPIRLFDSGPLTMQAMHNCDLLLWQDAVKQLDLNTAVHAPLRAELPRYIISGLGTPCPAPPAPVVRAIYLLGGHNNPDVIKMPVEGSKRVLAVLAAAFNGYLPQPSGLRQRLFLHLTNKLSSVAVYRLLRPRVGWSISALTNCVLEDLAL